MENNSEIETKIAFMENTLEKLNDVIVEHADEIDRLKIQLKHLNDKLHNLENNSETPEDLPPPHY